MSQPTPAMVGPFQLQARLGQGTIGVVYAAHDPVRDRPVAVKVMLPDVALDVSSRNHFLREARAISRLRHRHIVAVYDVGADDGPPYLAMELLRGTTLARRLTADPPLTLAESLDIVDQLLVGLQYAHEHGLVHRHVTPANIWLLDDGSVKLVDFGLLPAAGATVTDPRSVMGRVAYMPPEQVAGKAVDGRADIFSAGVVLYELVTGRRPFEADSITGMFHKVLNEAPAPLTGVPDAVAAPLAAILARALDKDPARRFADPLEMAADLTLARLALVETPRTADTRRVAHDETAEITVPREALREAARAPAAEEKRDAALLHHPVTVTPPVPAPERRLAALATWLSRERTLPSAALAGAGLAVALAIVAGVWLARRAPAVTSPRAVGTADTRTVPAVAEVQIESDPSEAELFLNGVSLGQRTPAAVAADRLRGGEIRAEKAGFEPAVVRIAPADLDRRRVTIALVSEAPPVVVTGRAAFPFEVLNGPVVVSRLATTHRFTVRGEQALRVRAPEYFLDRAVTIAPGQSAVNLYVPALGRLSVRTSPALERCRVSIAGRDFGTPPYPPIQYQPIVAGTHRVQLKCPDGSVKQEPVTVEASRDRSILFR